METRVLTLDPLDIDSRLLGEAAEILRQGGLVAFPTETVYGLGAIATDAVAVEGIFMAKGRPATNPIIVHVSDAGEARKNVTSWPETAERLAARFWPGPLTFVLPKASSIPDIVTAGGQTVAVRAPSHPVAQALLMATGLPIAAPSANRSTAVSPTEAAHVLKSLDGLIDIVIDGGACPGGIESTVLDLTSDAPTLLRPGLVTSAAIERVIGPIRQAARTNGGDPVRSPGMMERHYAPEASLEIAHGSGLERVLSLAQAGLRVGWMSQRAQAVEDDSLQDKVVILTMPNDPEVYAARLYSALHSLDKAQVDRIVVDALPAALDWLAIRDRLHRAAVSV
jgi:L-threonylcarbamoyladenylate synthase